MATEYDEHRMGREVAGYLLRIDIDLKLAIAFSLVALAFMFIPVLSGTFFRPFFGLAMVFFVPGYSLVSVLFPRRSDIGPVERAALAFGLSVAAVPLACLGLNFTPWGIRLVPIAACLAALTVACSLVADRRRHGLPPEERFSVDPAKLYAIARDALAIDGTAPDRALAVLLALSILVAALVVAYVNIFPKQGEKFTEFYVLGPDGKMDKYPLKFFAGEQKPVLVGIVDHEYRNVTYDLVVSLDDGPNSTALDSERVVLADNETWEKAVNLTSDRAGTDMKADFLLYKDGNMTAPYRECYLWVNVTQAAH